MESIKNRGNETEGCGDGPMRKMMALITRAVVESDLMGICNLGDRRQAESPETHFLAYAMSNKRTTSSKEENYPLPSPCALQQALAYPLT